MARYQQVTVAGKVIEIPERQIFQLKKLIADVGVLPDSFIKADSIADMKDSVLEIITDKITIVFPEVTPELFEQAYPSEIEALVQGFLEVNFSGLLKFGGTVLKTFMNGRSLGLSVDSGSNTAKPKKTSKN